ncbi:MAG: CapA family protein [Clostridia bacterium]|nr:CapA family protein [Clostridia bacterium]
MNIWKRLLCAALALCMFCCGCAASSGKEEQPELKDPDPAPVEQPELPAEPVLPEPLPEPEPEPEPVTLRLTAVGDDLLHNTLSMDSEQDDGSYCFDPLYAHIADIISGSDIAFINQEVMLTGQVSAYPNLAAPAEVADALIKVGFNVINLATNHSLDKGVKGLEACLENVHARPFEGILGAFRTEEEAAQLCILEKQGVRFGFLSYTYGLNGYRLPAGEEYKIALIDEDKMQQDLAAIRPLCDYLVVSMHWGNEYQHTQNQYQEQLAQLLCDGGADLIIGTHPHVLQPVEWIESDTGHRTLCAYSLGNFISGQHKRPTMLGGILDLRLKFDPDGTLLETVSAGVIPTVTYYGSKGGYTVYPLEQFTEEQAAAHGVKKYEKPLTLDYLNDLKDKVLGDFAVTWESLQ